MAKKRGHSSHWLNQRWWRFAVAEWVGLTLGFLDHWSADVRYYDTADYSRADCLNLIGNLNACDARVVGTVKATF